AVYLRTGSMNGDSLFNISVTDQEQSLWDLRVSWNQEELAFSYGSEEKPSKLYRLAFSRAAKLAEEVTGIEGVSEEETEAEELAEEGTEAEGLSEEVTEAEGVSEEETEAEALQEEETENEWLNEETIATGNEIGELLAPYGQLIAEHWQESTVVYENQSVLLHTLERNVSDCTVYRYKPTAEQIDTFLNKLADRLEEDEQLREFFAQALVQSLMQEQNINGAGQAGNMSAEELEEQGQELYDSLPSQIRSNVKNIGSELEKSALTLEVAMKGGMPVQVTLTMQQGNRLMNLFTMECYDQVEDDQHVYGYYAALNVGYGNTVIPVFLGIVENGEKISASVLAGTSSKKPAQFRGVMDYEIPETQTGTAWPEGVLAIAIQDVGELFLKTEKDGEAGKGLILADEKEAFDRITSNTNLLETPTDAPAVIAFAVTDENTALLPEGEVEEITVSSLDDMVTLCQDLFQDMSDSLSEAVDITEEMALFEAETESEMQPEAETETPAESEKKAGAKELFGSGSKQGTSQETENAQSNQTAEPEKPSLQEEIASEWRRLTGAGL
ncbi:MAG: hypothetical protein IJI24_05910, partial [Lachnospiraceae bacterium]|nr:hypothetical protein [Lachnospiraceae bacterium]